MNYRLWMLAAARQINTELVLLNAGERNRMLHLFDCPRNKGDWLVGSETLAHAMQREKPRDYTHMLLRNGMGRAIKNNRAYVSRSQLCLILNMGRGEHRQ